MSDVPTVLVTVWSLGGEVLCQVRVPQEITLQQLKGTIGQAAQCHVTRADHLCCGAETWKDLLSRPLMQLSDQVEVTWVKKEELQEGDELFYCGPSMASNSLVERGAVCTLRGGSNSHRDYTLVFFPQANTSLVVHRLHLSRSPPNAVPLPAGCDVGETFFYCGPLRRIGGRVLTPGARGEVVEAGLLEGSLRLRFQGFGFTLFSVEMQNLSKEAPRGCCSSIPWSFFLQALQQCAACAAYLCGRWRGL
ncbi:unnamed protein product [Durusdinium trenchii]|uniref:Uncharacterized protein n=1 Tax=Durusdinium trenchii TaxID=1381693 RepID=A0ABP0QGG0_9DINO